MATFKLDKKGIAGIASLCRRRALAVKQETAGEAFRYLVNFGYHSFLMSGPNGKNGPGWSYYYAANWNCSLNTVDKSVITPEREPNEEEGAYQAELGAKQSGEGTDAIAEAKFEDVIYVTNSVYYGRWLNDGGSEFRTHNTESHPNRFLELCESHLQGRMIDIVANAKRQVR